MKTIFFLFVMMLAPAFAQYKIYSDWVPTNESGVEYRWVVDDLSPRACTMQIRDLDKDGTSMVRVSIKYRSFQHADFITILIPVTRISRESAERILMDCTFLYDVNVDHIVRR
jgi:hypothetical protein